MPGFTIIVLDSVGVGELPDAAEFGDTGTNTLRHVDEYREGLNIPNLKQLGLYNTRAQDLLGSELPKGVSEKLQSWERQRIQRMDISRLPD